MSRFARPLRNLPAALFALLLLAAPAPASVDPDDPARGPAKPAAGNVAAIAPGLVNAYCPMPGVATGGQPQEQDYASFARAGYRTVLDLRFPEEPRGHDEKAAVKQAGLEYVELPVNATHLGARHFDAFRALMRDPAKKPVLVHCHSGNRVGAMMIPWLVLDEGRSEKDAVRLAKKMGLKSKGLEQLARQYVREQRQAAKRKG